LKIERLHELLRQLKIDLSSDNIEPIIFYRKDEIWFSIDPHVAAIEDVAPHLDKATNSSVAHHTSGSSTAWYFLENLEATIGLTFSKPPRTNTRKKYRNIISKIEQNCSNAYKVSHHPLTQLLSKDAFREKLATEILSHSTEAPTKTETQEIGQSRALAVLALDIDFFKQVNDTWGHLYGDQILKVFGKRLEHTAAKVHSSVEKPKIFLGHPSGEEFLITISAYATKEKILEWANNFRSAICEDILPTDDEWCWLCRYDNLSELTPPPVSERSITTSIGVALYSNASKSEIRDDQTSTLLDKADTALYRAKAAGRNQVIFYDEILSNCGRVIEQNPSTKIIAIDIGSNVGVTIGQEFKVFHPTFTGKVKFSVNDGRTTRTLGLYPRVESSRIVVFNTQPEISFACIEPNAQEASEAIEIGSHLEAIPAGSIGHLLANSSRYFPTSNSGGNNNPQNFVEHSSKNNNEIFAIVAKFHRDAEYIRKYGTVALNSALAKLYKLSQIKFQSAHAVEVLDRSSICIVGRQKAYKEKSVTDFANDMTSEFPELKVMIGVFNNTDKKSILEDFKLNLDPINTIEFARISASADPLTTDSRVNHFNPKSAHDSLKTLRETGSFDIAYADFERLVQIGVKTSLIYNTGGLLAHTLGLPRAALKHHLSAIQIDPDNIILRSNYGTIANSLDEVEPGLEILSALSDDSLKTILENHFWGYISYVSLLAKAKQQNLPHFDATKFLKMAHLALAHPEIEKFPKSAQSIQRAIAESSPQAIN